MQQFPQAFGTATVVYPVATAEGCTVALLLEVDPVRLARSRAKGHSLDLLRQRQLGTKRRLAQREHGLGLDALAAFVAGEPLWRVHQAVFAVLALESEPVDPRL